MNFSPWPPHREVRDQKLGSTTEPRCGKLTVGQEQLRHDNRPQRALMARDDAATANFHPLINFVLVRNLSSAVAKTPKDGPVDRPAIGYHACEWIFIAYAGS